MSLCSSLIIAVIVSFLIELRNIAVNRRQISSTTLTRMKKAPILLGSQRKRHQTTEKGQSQSYSADLDEDDWDLQYDLRRADQIVIVDDNNGYQIFGDQIFTAPQEDIIESELPIYAGEPINRQFFSQASIPNLVHDVLAR